jgi:hypothetical protein
MKAGIIIFGSIIFLYSCGRSGDKERLAHKWIVKSAYSILVEDASVQHTPDKIDMANQMSQGLDSLYKGIIYDLTEDGSFTITKQTTTIRGKWTFENDQVEFKSSDGTTEVWTFKHGFEVYGDTSIRVYTGNNEVILTLKAAPGQTIETNQY